MASIFQTYIHITYLNLYLKASRILFWIELYFGYELQFQSLEVILLDEQYLKINPCIFSTSNEQ